VLEGADRSIGKPFATPRSEVIATHGIAATSQPLATQIALDLLKTGRQCRRCGNRSQCRTGINGTYRKRSMAGSSYTTGSVA